MTDLYAVIGNPVEHSKSPLIHAEFARQTAQDLEYGRILAPLEGFEAAVREFIAAGGRGLNVTVPFKQQAWELSTCRSERATLARAVNTLKFENGEIWGDNTDGAGLVADIGNNLGIDWRQKRILLLGAGGAARGVVGPILDAGVDSIVIANRTVHKANEIAGHFSERVRASSFVDLSGCEYDIVINATASSLSGDCPPLPQGVFARDSLAYDMMYGKDLTPFLVFAQQEGAARVADGLGMLVEQAAESFYFWRQLRPDTAAVLALLKS